FFFSSRRRHTRSKRDWSSDVCSSDLLISASLEGQIFFWGPYEKLHLPLLGQHQLYNAAVVLTIVNALREKGLVISDEAVRTGIRSEERRVGKGCRDRGGAERGQESMY